MRKIYFRGKRVSTGEWVYGWYVKATGEWHKYWRHEDWIVTYAMSNGGWFTTAGRAPVIKETVGQFTGLRDMNNKPIYEGDILKYHKPVSPWMSTLQDGENAAVEYDMGGFCVVQRNNPICQYRVSLSAFYGAHGPLIEVVGNVYDNPDLLEVKA